jgi:hypothetical protein
MLGRETAEPFYTGKLDAKRYEKDFGRRKQDEWNK